LISILFSLESIVSEQEQNGKTNQPDEPERKKEDVFVLMLLPGETATLERAPKKNLNDPPQWQVKVETPGRQGNSVRVTYPMDKELQITSTDMSGLVDNATIVIPETVGKNTDDKIPQIKVLTKNPVSIIGGDVIITGGTALIPVSPKGFTAENKPTVNDGEKDKRLEKDSISLRFDADKDSKRGVRGDMRTVTVEREPETNIIFIDPSTRDPKDPKSSPKDFYTLSALNPEDSMRNYDAIIANRAREAAQKKSGGKKPEQPKETRNLKPLGEQERQAVSQSLNDARTSLEQLKGSSFAKDADLQGLIDLSNNIMVGNTIHLDKLNEFRTKLANEKDNAIKKSSPIEAGLQRIIDNLDKNDSLKISMNEQLSPQALAAATGAARGAANIILAQADAGSSNKSPLQTEAIAQGLAGARQA
jgi:hypothetical protein